MARLLTTLAAVAVTLAGARAETGTGMIRSEDASIEILAPHGDREIRTPEGFIRAEEADASGQEAGSFGIVHVRTVDDATPTAGPGAPDARSGSGTAAARRSIPVEPSGIVDRAAPGPGTDPCHDQRSRYLQRLLTAAGIDVAEP